MNKNPLQIVLLPGLDGTGRLFDPLKAYLPIENTTVIALPKDGKQDYAHLTQYCQSRLPSGPYILVAESFSGPIGLQLAASDSMLVKLILVATFAKPPKPFISKLCSYLPLKKLIRMPFAGPASRILFFGFDTPKDTITNFMAAVGSVPAGTMAERLREASTFNLGQIKIAKPVTYIQPSNDRLVPKRCFGPVADRCADIALKTIVGPHFILQASPKRCAAVILSVAGY